MKIIPALFFISLGIWIAFTYPDLANQAFSYILTGIDWIKTMLGGL